MKLVTDPADPRRCKFSFPHEQCWREAEYGSEFCLAHGGKSTEQAEKKRLYHLAEVDNRQRLAELSGHDGIKTLREEIGLVRMLIEKQVNSAKGDTELMSRSGSINNLILTLSRLMKDCHTLEVNLGELLSKQTVFRLIQSMCEIVVQELQGIEGYEEIIDRISDRLYVTVGKAQNFETLQLPPP